MEVKQVNLIRASWRQVAPIADQAAVLFYQRLFQLDPALAPRFAGIDMRAQRVKLVQTLSAVIDSLGDLESIQPQVDALGRRHAGYGASAGDYETVGEALLWTLEQGLGDAWNSELENAWTTAYQWLAESMLSAAGSETAASSDIKLANA